MSLSVDQMHSLLLEIQRSLQDNARAITKEQATQLMADVGEIKATLGLGVGLSLPEGNVLTELREIRRGVDAMTTTANANAAAIAALREANTRRAEDVIREEDVKRLLAAQDRRWGLVEKALVTALVAVLVGLVGMGAVMWVRVNAMTPQPAVIGKP